jgi:hypothetical protein
MTFSPANVELAWARWWTSHKYTAAAVGTTLIGSMISAGALSSPQASGTWLLHNIWYFAIAQVLAPGLRAANALNEKPTPSPATVAEAKQA